MDEKYPIKILLRIVPSLRRKARYTRSQLIKALVLRTLRRIPRHWLVSHSAESGLRNQAIVVTIVAHGLTAPIFWIPTAVNPCCSSSSCLLGQKLPSLVTPRMEKWCAKSLCSFLRTVSPLATPGSRSEPPLHRLISLFPDLKRVTFYPNSAIVLSVWHDKTWPVIEWGGGETVQERNKKPILHAIVLDFSTV